RWSLETVTRRGATAPKPSPAGSPAGAAPRPFCHAIVNFQQSQETTMPTPLKVYVNEDDALLFWSISAPIAGCRGFAVERKRTDAKGKKSQDYLPNRTGFENEAAPAKPEEGQHAVLKPSTEWPFQRFSWTD